MPLPLISGRARVVRLLLIKCKSTAYVPGKFPENRGGRKRTYTEHQEKEAARVAMTLKAQRRRVCPALVGATLPKKLVNPDTGKPMSDWKLRQTFQTRCHDEDEDDPWEWLTCASLTCPARSLDPLTRSLARSLARLLARFPLVPLAGSLAPCLLARSLARSAPLACPARSFARSLAHSLARLPRSLARPARSLARSLARLSL